MNFQKAFDSFMSADFEKGVDSSTKASWGGGGYSVELFQDGSYRLLWDEQIGNLYDSEGIILSIPTLNDEEWDEDPSIRFYENAADCIRDNFIEKIAMMESAQQ